MCLVLFDTVGGFGWEGAWEILGAGPPVEPVVCQACGLAFAAWGAIGVKYEGNIGL